MNVRMGLLCKKPDWTVEAFLAYWHDKHGPLAAQAPELREYWQNHVTERLKIGSDIAHGPWDFDGFSQLYFADARQASRAFSTSEIAEALIADERHFLGVLHIVTAEQNVVIPLPRSPERERLFKRIAILKRRADVSEADFRREWIVHRKFIRRVPGVAGYRQNVVIARERTKGQPCGYDDLPIDGIAELWIEDPALLEVALRAPLGREAMEHARTFLQDITAFAVREHRVV